MSAAGPLGYLGPSGLPKNTDKKMKKGPSMKRKGSKSRLSMPSMSNLIGAATASTSRRNQKFPKPQPGAPRSVEIIRRVSQAGIAPPPTQKTSGESPSPRRPQMLSKQDRILGVSTNSPQHSPPKRRFDSAPDPYSTYSGSIDWDEDEMMDHGLQESWFDLDVVEEIPDDGGDHSNAAAPVELPLRPATANALRASSRGSSRAEQRPKIQVSIPEAKRLSFSGSFWEGRADGAKEVVPSATNTSVSPPSTALGQSAGIVPLKYSTVSPLAKGVEMPTPQRPFSSIGLDLAMSEPVPENDTTAGNTSSSSSAKSAEPEEDGATSSYSRRSSMSSVVTDLVPVAIPKPLLGGRTGSAAFSISSPAAAGIFDENQRSNPRFSQFKNKPLPPEPSPEVVPLHVGGKPTDRPRKVGLGGSPIRTPSTEGKSRRKPKPSHISLQSKYSPTELDKLDEAFRRSSPTRLPGKGSPTLDEATDDLEASLSGSNNQGPISWDESLAMNVPIQISRGALDMIPSRPAPTPPAGEVPAIPPRSDKRNSRVGSSIATPRETSRAASREASPTERPRRMSLGALRRISEWSIKTRNSSTSSCSDRRRASVHSGQSSPYSEFANMYHKISDASAISLPPDSMKILVEVAPKPKKAEAVSKSHRDASATVSADDGEKIILRILESIDNLPDLFSTAAVSKGFYHIFKRHEMHLIRDTVFKVSPAAWELREISPPWAHGDDADHDEPVPEYTPTSYLRHYSRDMYIMIALKPLILVYCESFLRPETVAGLAGIDGERSAQIDEAFCRIWTFCRMFGCNKDREDDVTAQMDWLRGGRFTNKRNMRLADRLGVDSSEFTRIGSVKGLSRFADPFSVESTLFDPPPSFGAGNGSGLTSDELYAMTELWNCLGALVQGYHGKCAEARAVGIFDGADVIEGDTTAECALLEEWTYYLLTLGPAVILNLAMVSPSAPTAATFSRAHEAGWTKWSPPIHGASRSTFLKEAVSRVYSTKVTAEAVLSDKPGPRAPSPKLSDSRLDSHLNRVFTARKRQAALAEELKNLRRINPAGPKTFSDERPISLFPEVVEKLEHLATAEIGVGEVVVGQPPKGPQVRDPVDVAMDRLVGQLGFDPQDAKRALAETDKGDSIDVKAAIALLAKESKIRQVQGVAARPPSLASIAPHPATFDRYSTFDSSYHSQPSKASTFGPSEMAGSSPPAATVGPSRMPIPKREGSAYSTTTASNNWNQMAGLSEKHPSVAAYFALKHSYNNSAVGPRRQSSSAFSRMGSMARASTTTLNSTKTGRSSVDSTSSDGTTDLKLARTNTGFKPPPRASTTEPRTGRAASSIQKTAIKEGIAGPAKERSAYASQSVIFQHNRRQSQRRALGA